MQWSDDALVVSVRPHGETAAMAELFTRDHGRHMGLAQGGRSRRMRPVLQIGNQVEAVWKARLSADLGQFSLELSRANAARAMDSPLALAGLGALCALARLLPERDPHPNLFEMTLFVLRYFEDANVWPPLFARWELRLLEELGFGLDLAACAATGARDNLVYVSPRSGRAVSAEAGRPYAGKLLPLPAFLIDGRAQAQARDVAAALSLTGYFLEERILRPRGQPMPDSRARFVPLLTRDNE